LIWCGKVWTSTKSSQHKMPAKISKTSRSVKGTIHLPFSKSISNRALILNWLTGKKTALHNLSDADDTILLKKILDETGKAESGKRIINAGNAGTVYRFLTALLSFTAGEFELTGNVRMGERPIKSLVEALRVMGASIYYLDEEGYPPLKIMGGEMLSGNTIVSGAISSQFISALLLISPLSQTETNIKVKGKMASAPYIKMTESVLKSFGYLTRFENDTFHVAPGGVKEYEFFVERDWSAAAFWFQMAFLADEVDVFFPGLTIDSIQGDKIIADLLRSGGLNISVNKEGLHIFKKSHEIPAIYQFNFRDCPDIALPVIYAMAGRSLPALFHGLDNLMYKETDRLSALNTELRRMGITFIRKPGGVWELLPSVLRSEGVTSCTYSDHRMAMGLASLGVTGNTITLDDPDCVSKSYPGFWEDMRSVGFVVEYF